MLVLVGMEELKKREAEVSELSSLDGESRRKMNK